ncbi:MAG TPA: hypothetical protein VK497_03075 [Candidatus Saccharimonadales bacterium]|nr:hypothetical protein [Candidatus Saccharimonadales bacterium]
MSVESPTQVHHLPDGHVVVGEHPDPVFDGNKIIQRLHETSSHQQSEFDTFLAEAPNLNEKYADVIEIIRNKVRADGLRTDVDITILDDETYARAHEIIGDTGNSQGHVLLNRILLREDARYVEAFGDQYGKYLIGVGLHESAHADKSEEKTGYVTTQERLTEALGKEGLAGTVNRMFYGGHLKLNALRDTLGKSLGEFWEEGSADLYRVKAMNELGIAWEDIPGAADTQVTPDDSTKVKYVGRGKNLPNIASDTKSLAVPLKYAGGALSTGPQQVFIHPSLSGIAAYGINLLDQRAPGLYDDLMKGRKDPEAYRHFVQKVESIQPGLYRNLSRLSQDTMSFVYGTKDILRALDLDDKELST